MSDVLPDARERYRQLKRKGKAPANGSRLGIGRRPEPLPATRGEMLDAVARLDAMREELAYQIGAHLRRFGHDYPSGENGACLYCGKVGNPGPCVGCSPEPQRGRRWALERPDAEAATSFLLSFRIPPDADVGGYAYIILFANGMVKIGSTAKPEQRFATLEGHAAAFGTVISLWWISRAHAEYVDTERLLLDSARGLGGRRRGREYFEGLDFNAVLDIANRSAP
jgi:hypothetical protein